MVLLGGENADSYAEYIAELEQNHVLAMYRLQTPDKDWSEEGSTKSSAGEAKRLFRRRYSGVYLI